MHCEKPNIIGGRFKKKNCTTHSMTSLFQ